MVRSCVSKSYNLQSSDHLKTENGDEVTFGADILIRPGDGFKRWKCEPKIITLRSMVLNTYKVIAQILSQINSKAIKLDWPQTWGRSASRTPRRTRRRTRSRGRWSWWERTHCKPGRPSRTPPKGWRRVHPWEGCRHELAGRCKARSECPRPLEGLVGCRCTRMDPKTGSSRCRCSRLKTQPFSFCE